MLTSMLMLGSIAIKPVINGVVRTPEVLFSSVVNETPTVLVSEFWNIIFEPL